jgi:hypothetical protein
MMRRVRVAVAFLIAVGCGQALAQKPALAKLTLTISDQTGARIPLASVVATRSGTRERFESQADSSGQVVLKLNPDRYDLQVQSRGFIPWAEQGLDVTGQSEKSVVLKIVQVECGPCVVSELRPDSSTEAVLTVIVSDQTGARLSGAKIIATRRPDGDSILVPADASGEAVLRLEQGLYDLRIEAKGFSSWVETGVDVTRQLQKSVVLRVSNPVYWGPWVETMPLVPLETSYIEALIPLEPIQQLPLTATKLQGNKRHWF